MKKFLVFLFASLCIFSGIVCYAYDGEVLLDGESKMYYEYWDDIYTYVGLPDGLVFLPYLAHKTWHVTEYGDYLRDDAVFRSAFHSKGFWYRLHGGIAKGTIFEDWDTVMDDLHDNNNASGYYEYSTASSVNATNIINSPGDWGYDIELDVDENMVQLALRRKAEEELERKKQELRDSLEYAIDTIMAEIEKLEAQNASGDDKTIEDKIKELEKKIDEIEEEIGNISGSIIYTDDSYQIVFQGEDSVSTKISYIKGMGESSVAFRINYDANGGTSAPNSQIRDRIRQNDNRGVDLSSQLPSRPGYIFLGWSRNPYARYGQYQPGGRYKNILEKVSNWAEILKPEDYGSKWYDDSDEFLEAVHRQESIWPNDVTLYAIWKIPELIFDPDDTNPYRESISKQYNTGLSINNLNTQYVNQDKNKNYWVLDEDGEIKIKFVQGNADGYDVYYNTTFQFPFDVFIDKEYVEAGKPFTKKIQYTQTDYNPNGELRVYEGSVKIHVAAWAKEGSYETGDNQIKVTIEQNFGIDGIYNTTPPSTDEIGINIVGKIYDFSVTNILGDDIWKTSLFANGVTDNGEHEADTLPVGQGNNGQNPKYIYGIKQGSKIYFSVNTKGADNNSIKIVPKFYYVDKDGGTVEEVDAYSKGQKLTEINLSRRYNATDNYRITNEYRAELLKGREIYGNIYGTAALGNYGNITLPEATRTPYVGYWTSKTDKEAMYSKIGITEAELPETLKGKQLELYKTVSHWYGDYMIPQDTKYMPVGKAYNDTEAKKYADGFVIVYFSIVSTRGDSHENYLAYNRITAPNTKTQWLVERNEKGDNIILPKTSISNNNTKIATPWMENPTSAINGNIAVVIYHTSQSTTQNYDSAGTH